MAGRYTGIVRFRYSGDKNAGLQYSMLARALTEQLYSPAFGRNKKIRNFSLMNGVTIRVQKHFGLHIAEIYVPPGGAKELESPGAFVIYPYTGWLYPAYFDRRQESNESTVPHCKPAYYTKKLEDIPTAPYWLDTLDEYIEGKTTEYKIEKIGKKNADIDYDPVYVQALEDLDSWPDDEDDHYTASNGHWRDGYLDEDTGEWVPGDWFLHWTDTYSGSILQQETVGYEESGWGKFIYVNGVKFPAPGYVRGGAVYHDTTTGTDWLLITTWIEAKTVNECTYNKKANVWIIRLEVNDRKVPIAPDNNYTYTIAEFTTTPSLDTSNNWYPINDDIAGFLVPRTATARGSYPSDCGTGWDGESYLGPVFGFRFNQGATKFCYAADIEGATAVEFNEFTLSIAVTLLNGYMMPTTFSETLTAQSYTNTTVSDFANRKDGNFHTYGTDKIIIGVDYKENVLQKLQCTVEVKLITFANSTVDYRETYVNRKWYINSTLLASQSLSKISTGLDWEDYTLQSLSDAGDFLVYYDLQTGDSVIESYTSDWVFGSAPNHLFNCTYARKITVDGSIISEDAGTHTNIDSGSDPREGWPMDEFGDYAWMMSGSLHHMPDFTGAGPSNTTQDFYAIPTDSFYTDRVHIFYFWAGGGGPGHLRVHRGHEQGHVAGYFCGRSVNAGPNGLYFTDTPDPYTYTHGTTDERFRTRQSIFVLGVQDTSGMYGEFGVREGADNTVPVINTCFYRKKDKWDEH